MRLIVPEHSCYYKCGSDLFQRCPPSQGYSASVMLAPPVHQRVVRGAPLLTVLVGVQRISMQIEMQTVNAQLMRFQWRVKLPLGLEETLDVSAKHGTDKEFKSFLSPMTCEVFIQMF